MSEFRQDPISGDWIILAPGRAKRPDDLLKKKVSRQPSLIRTCPFEQLESGSQWPPLAAYPDIAHWKIVAVKNKYPSLDEHRDVCASEFRRGVYRGKTGVGVCELVIGRDHNKNFAGVDLRTAEEIFVMFQERHRAMMKDKCVVYLSTFFNWGTSAGASLWHPHYQIFALPFVPPHAAHSLRDEEAYFKAKKRCARCDVIAAERKHGMRIIAENRHAIAFAPYAAKKPFELSITPKNHFPFFSKTPRSVLSATAELLQVSMRRLKKYANDPDLNFFIHGAPVDGNAYPHHHWHIELMPKISIPAGFELSTGLEVNVLDPDEAAAILRGERKNITSLH